MEGKEARILQLKQYVFGRLPTGKGFDMIARTADLVFFDPQWMGEARYGSAPTLETPERIWSRRYEMQAMERGALLSCLYPLKQTETPCREQRPPYLRGITPAAHHVQLCPGDFRQLMGEPERLVYFDSFLDIDEIYRLPGQKLAPLDFPQGTPPLPPPDDVEAGRLRRVAPAVWRAFVAREKMDVAALRESRVFCVVPASDPAGELAAMRRFAALLLRLLPEPVRLLCSVTLNVEAESAELPPRSALYLCHRARPEAQISHSGRVFDMEREVYPAEDPREAAYFADRQRGAHQTLCRLAEGLPVALAVDLDLYLWLHELERQVAGPEGVCPLAAWGRLVEWEREEAAFAPILSAFIALYTERAGRGTGLFTGEQTRFLWALLGWSDRLEERERQALFALLERPGLGDLLRVALRLEDTDLPTQNLPQDAYFLEAAAQHLIQGTPVEPEWPQAITRRQEELSRRADADAIRRLCFELLMAQGKEHKKSALALLETPFLLDLATPAPRGLMDALRLTPQSLCGLLQKQMERAAEHGRGNPSPLEELTLAALIRRQAFPDLGLDFYRPAVLRLEALTAGHGLWARFLLPSLHQFRDQEGYAELLNRTLRIPQLQRNHEIQEVLRQVLPAAQEYAAEKLLSSLDSPQALLRLEADWRAELAMDFAFFPRSLSEELREKIQACIQRLDVDEWMELQAAIAAHAVPAVLRRIIGQAHARRAGQLLARDAQGRIPIDTQLWMQEIYERYGEQPIEGAADPHSAARSVLRGLYALTPPEREGEGRASFLELRQFSLSLSPEAWAFLEASIRENGAASYEAQILLAQGLDGGIRWISFTEECLQAFGAPESDLARFETWSARSREWLLSIWVRVFDDGAAGASPTWNRLLYPGEKRTLYQVVAARYPQVVRWLESGDVSTRALPEELRRRLPHQRENPRRVRRKK